MSDQITTISRRPTSSMDPEETLSLKETLSSLPQEVPSTDLFSVVRERQKSSSLPILVVLDDDPTGTQTCHSINVLTVWDQKTLIEEFSTTTSGFFILTNSRALHTPEARELIREICVAIKSAANTSGKQFEVVLRGDSTLRGHFPDEPEIAQEVLGEVDGWILAPYFRQGGRLTINDIHYVADYPAEKLVPAAQTPFAKDASFGYKESDLKKYVVEKAQGRIEEDRVCSISLSDLREGGPRSVTEKLLGFKTGSVIIVNAAADTDMEVFVQGLLEAQTHNKRYLYRTGAAFVSTRLGISQIPPLTPSSLFIPTDPSAPGGLILAGSHVPKTTSQLSSLTTSLTPHLHVYTLDVAALISQTHPSTHSPSNSSIASTLSPLLTSTSLSLTQGHDVLLMTSRTPLTSSSASTSLAISATVARALVLFLQTLTVRPRYLVAKGGITSSDAAARALAIRRARVLGQAAPGVPLWRCADGSSKWAGIPLVVFPGNVGEKDALTDLVRAWAKEGAY